MPQRIEHDLSTGETATLELTADEVVDLEALQANAPAEMWKEVRQKRNRLLAESDFTQLPDVAVDAAFWVTYRQALRDVGGQADPTDITWPTPPE